MGDWKLGVEIIAFYFVNIFARLGASDPSIVCMFLCLFRLSKNIWFSLSIAISICVSLLVLLPAQLVYSIVIALLLFVWSVMKKFPG